jgi:hypothetical protein
MTFRFSGRLRQAASATWLVSLLWPWSAVGWAQTAPARPDPLDARAPVPAASHVSPWGRYRAWRDTEVGDWKAANDTVARIGGWRTYAREAAAPASGPTLPAPASVPRP